MGFDESCPSNRSVNTGEFNWKEQKKKGWNTGANTRTSEMPFSNHENGEDWNHLEKEMAGPVADDMRVLSVPQTKKKKIEPIKRTWFLNVGHCNFRDLLSRFQWTVQYADHPNDEADDARFIERYLRLNKSNGFTSSNTCRM